LYAFIECISLCISLLPIIIFLLKPQKKALNLPFLVLFLCLCSFEIDVLSIIVIQLKQSNHTLVGIFNVLSSVIYSALMYQLMKETKHATIFTILNLGTIACLISDGLYSSEHLINSKFYFFFSFLILVECIILYRHSLVSYLKTESWNTSTFLLSTGIFVNFSLTIVLTMYSRFLSDPNYPDIQNLNDLFIFQLMANISQYILFSFALWKIPS
jgi:hypothetical protein